MARNTGGYRAVPQRTGTWNVIKPVVHTPHVCLDELPLTGGFAAETLIQCTCGRWYYNWEHKFYSRGREISDNWWKRVRWYHRKKRLQLQRATIEELSTPPHI